jgi:predicted nucleic acid-binding protein
MAPVPLVMDASIAVSIARGEEASGPAHALIRARVRAGGKVVVPSHFWLEVANALLGRHRWTSAALFEAVHVLDRLGPQTVDLDRPTLLSAIDLVERHGLTAYDATYLALADATDGELITFDRALRAAAGARAVPLDGRHRLSETRAPYEHDVTWPDYKGASAYLAKLRVEAREAAAS